jgi:hypothetical protein
MSFSGEQGQLLGLIRCYLEDVGLSRTAASLQQEAEEILPQSLDAGIAYRWEEEQTLTPKSSASTSSP